MQSSQFEKLWPIILRHEGVSETNPTGYAKITNDPGGETNWGISQRAWSLIHPRFGAFPSSVRNLTRDMAHDIYINEYYLPLFDKLDPGPALICFDCQVNSGNAIKILQRAIGAIDDGIWGPTSEHQLYLARRDIPGLCDNLLWKRAAFYAEISRSSPANQVFLAKFWIPRLIQTRAEARTL